MFTTFLDTKETEAACFIKDIVCLKLGNKNGFFTRDNLWKLFTVTVLLMLLCCVGHVLLLMFLIRCVIR